VFASVVVVGIVTAGCSPTDEAQQETENANAAVCLSLEGLAATIQGLQDGVTGTGDVTVGQAQESVNQIQSAYDTVQAELANLGDAVDNQVATAQQEFEQAQMQIKEDLSGMDGDASLSEVAEQEKEAVQNLQSSYQELNSTLGCGSAS
jgi:cobalamin biosynthesis Mg chelatase CobN